MSKTEFLSQTQSPKYINPWSSGPGYIYLGAVTVSTNVFGGKPIQTRYELYAIENQNHLEDTAFGARYGDEGQEYYSGSSNLWVDIKSSTPINHAVKAYLSYKLTGSASNYLDSLR
jgi:hypothetical protein